MNDRLVGGKMSTYSKIYIGELGKFSPAFDANFTYEIAFII